MPKFKTAAVLDPEFVTVACAPAVSVVIEPTETVAAAPATPATPVGPTPPASAITAQICGY